MSPTAIMLNKKAMSSGPLHKSCQTCSWGTNWPHSDASIILIKSGRSRRL